MIVQWNQICTNINNQIYHLLNSLNNQNSPKQRLRYHRKKLKHNKKQRQNRRNHQRRHGSPHLNHHQHKNLKMLKQNQVNNRNQNHIPFNLVANWWIKSKLLSIALKILLVWIVKVIRIATTHHLAAPEANAYLAPLATTVEKSSMTIVMPVMNVWVDAA